MNANGKVERQRLPHHVFARRDPVELLSDSDDLSETAAELQTIWHLAFLNIPSLTSL